MGVVVNAVVLRSRMGRGQTFKMGMMVRDQVSPEIVDDLEPLPQLQLELEGLRALGAVADGKMREQKQQRHRRTGDEHLGLRHTASLIWTLRGVCRSRAARERSERNDRHATRRPRIV